MMAVRRVRFSNCPYKKCSPIPVKQIGIAMKKEALKLGPKKGCTGERITVGNRSQES